MSGESSSCEVGTSFISLPTVNHDENEENKVTLANESTAEIKINLDEEIANKQSLNSDIDDPSAQLCRICFGTQYNDTTLIEPCLCKGTVGKVHRQCLERWLNFKKSTACELCSFEFHVKVVPRYGCLQSITIWMAHRNRRNLFIFDFFVLLLMNVVVLGMISVLVHSIKAAYDDERLRRLIPLWYVTLMTVATVFWLAIYVLSFVMFANSQIFPWYRWWRSNKRIYLLVN